jgi:hypothetical protein
MGAVQIYVSGSYYEETRRGLLRETLGFSIFDYTL